MEFKEWLRAQWDRVGASIAIGAGAFALLLGWIGVRNAVYPGQQIPYIISGGLAALFLIGVGSALWLSADLRDEWRKLDDIDEKLGQLVAQHSQPAAQPDDHTGHPLGTAAAPLGQATVERHVGESDAAAGYAARRRRPLQPTV